RAARGPDRERRCRFGAGGARARRDNAAGPALQQLALLYPRVPRRRRKGAGRADRVPGHGPLGGRGDPPPRAELRLRDRVPARGAGRGPARAVGAGTHDLSGAAQPFPPLGGYLAPGAGLHALRPADHFRCAMNILISNDDGILARGLGVLGEVCAALGQVTVVAPDREQSGTSHSLTLHRPVRATRRPDGAFQVDGTPTDCVMLAIGALSDGYISVTPLHMDMTNYGLIGVVRKGFPGD